MREQLAADTARHREAIEATTCRLRTEESQKCSLEERLEKTHDELQKMKAEHCNVSFAAAAVTHENNKKSYQILPTAE